MTALRRGQDGQVVTAVVVMTLGCVLAVVLNRMVPLGGATDEAGQASNAADAAALGAAASAREWLLARFAVLRFEDLDGLGRGGTCSIGRAGADAYAARNGARVTSYCYDAGRNRIDVEVQMRSTAVVGPRAQAASAASLGLDLRSCARRDDPAPTTTTAVTTLPPPPPPPAAPPAPAYPPGTELRCAGTVLGFAVAPDGRVTLTPPGRLAGLLVPRLVG
ncbi:MAG TPA: hypothetical protein VFJ85_14505 [Acidimicrobiales bacterium]|nr:hypothetical protein [Acidimicrobiales bacterium]